MTMVIVLASGTPRTGLWCPKCLLPSGYDVVVYGLFESGPQPMGRIRECDDCGAPLPPDQDAA